MKAAMVILVSFVFFFLQISVITKISIGSVSPDFPLLLVVYLALNCSIARGTIIGFIIGLVQDLFNPSLLGLGAMIKSITGYVIGEVNARTVVDTTPFMMLLFFVSKLGGDLIYSLFFFRLDPGRIATTFFTVSLPSAVYTAVLGGCIHLLAKYVSSKASRTLGKA